MYRQCAVCHRTLLMGERSFRFTPGGEDWVDVCALCTDQADEHATACRFLPRPEPEDTPPAPLKAI